MTFKTIQVEKAAAAIEADAGEVVPDLRQALVEINNYTKDRIELFKNDTVQSLVADIKSKRTN